MYQANGTARKISLISITFLLLVLIGCSTNDSSTILGAEPATDISGWNLGDDQSTVASDDSQPQWKPDNFPPIIASITCSNNYPAPGEVLSLTVDASDPDNDHLNYSFNTYDGCCEQNGCSACWTLPEQEGTFRIKVAVTDGTYTVTKTFLIAVSDHPNLPYDE